MRWPNDDSATFAAAVTGSVDRVDRNPLAAAMNWGVARPLIRLWSWSGAVNVNCRIWVRALTLAWRADRLATASTRMASTAPSLDLALPRTLPDRTARAASTAS